MDGGDAADLPAGASGCAAGDGLRSAQGVCADFLEVAEDEGGGSKGPSQGGCALSAWAEVGAIQVCGELVSLAGLRPGQDQGIRIRAKKRTKSTSLYGTRSRSFGPLTSSSWSGGGRGRPRSGVKCTGCRLATQGANVGCEENPSDEGDDDSTGEGQP